MKDQYFQYLLSNEIKTINDLFNSNSNLKLLEKRENLEMIKKIIDYYLIYVVELNFDSISKKYRKI